MANRLSAKSALAVNRPNRRKLDIAQSNPDQTQLTEPGETVLQLERSFGYLFRQANRSFTAALAKRLKSHGITLAQWYFLRELWREDGISQRELSSRMDVSEPTTTVAINVMEKSGLITRRRDPLQRNKINVRLTQKGRKLQDDVQHIALDVNIDASQGIDERELQIARRVILKLMGNLNGEKDPR
jgi:DNA-binding MarR family transcriptional regulator